MRVSSVCMFLFIEVYLALLVEIEAKKEAPLTSFLKQLSANTPTDLGTSTMYMKIVYELLFLPPRIKLHVLFVH